VDLLRWADKNGMATEIGAPTNYAELTIGGVISANGHGTGSNVTSSMVSHDGRLHTATGWVCRHEGEQIVDVLICRAPSPFNSC
jgi:hypothetical protein